MEQIQPILDALRSRYGWVAALAAWLPGIMFLFRFMKPVNLRLQAALTRALVNASMEKEDAYKWHDKVLVKGWYIAFCFLVDFMLTIKLPTHGDFHDMMKDRCEKGGICEAKKIG